MTLPLKTQAKSSSQTSQRSPVLSGWETLPDLAAVLDCFDGSIQGVRMDNNMRAELCEQALENACRNTNRQSMFHKGRFLTQWPKTFLAVLKCERVPLQHYDFLCTAQTDLCSYYIEAFYSNVRPHSALGWLSPSAFE